MAELHREDQISKHCIYCGSWRICVGGMTKSKYTCDLHREGQVFRRCVYFEDRQGRPICNNKNGPLSCPTGGQKIG